LIEFTQRNFVTLVDESFFMRDILKKMVFSITNYSSDSQSWWF